MNSHLVKIVAPSIVLILFYWLIYLSPGGPVGAALLTPEKTRELLDQSRSRMREERWTEALELTRQLHDAYPDNHIYLGQLATIYNTLECVADSFADML